MQMNYILGVAQFFGRISGGWQRFDGVNDHVLLGDSEMYKVAGQDFTLHVRCRLLQLSSNGTGSRVAYFFAKGQLVANKPADYRYYLIGTISGSDQRIGFAFGNGAGDTGPRKGFGIPVSIEDYLGETLDLFYYRKNQDGTLAAAENPANYFVEVNGVEYGCQSFFNRGTITADPFDNPEPVQIRQTTSGDFMGYLNRLAFYVGVLDKETRDQIRLNDNYPAVGNRGVWKFNSKGGRTLYDDSAIANDGQLQNYTDLEVGVPDSSTQVSFATDVIIFKPTRTTGVHTAKKDYTIYKFVRFRANTALVVTATHRRNGEVIASFPIAFNSAGVALQQVQLLAGDDLEFQTNSDVYTISISIEIYES